MTTEQPKPGPTPIRPRKPRRGEDPRAEFPIDVRDTSLPKMAAVAWSAVQHFNDPPTWFVAGNSIVRVEGGTHGTPVQAREATADMMSQRSARTAFWFKPIEARGDVEQFPLERVMRDMLADPAPPLPPLDRIVTAPAYGADGALASTPGYNPASRIYYAPGDLVVPDVPEAPSEEETRDALGLIEEDLLGDFPFTGPAEKAHAIALLLNPFVRDLVDGPTPLFMVEAPNAGTGKGLLASVALYPSIGNAPVLMPPASQDEEMRKRITATLASLPEAILLDNINKAIDSPSLAAALTAGTWTDRILTQSSIRSFRIRATWVATANNPVLTREVSRRTVRIRLDAGIERPETRSTFRHRRIEHWVRLNRGYLVAAALTLVNRWLSTGALPGSYVLGSYDSWAAVLGGVLDACGVEGFLSNREAAEASVVSEEAAWAALVAVWWEEFKDRPVTVAGLYELARDRVDGFPLKGNSDRGMRTSFGMQLARQRDRVFNARTIRAAPLSHGTAQYHLEHDETPPF